jgi:hypothetical protein
VHDGGPAWAYNGRTTGEDGQVRSPRATIKPRDVRSGDANRQRVGLRQSCRLGSPIEGSILVQRQVSAPLVIVGEVALQVPTQRALVPHDDVIEALAPEGSDHAFHERILPKDNKAPSPRLRCCAYQKVSLAANPQMPTVLNAVRAVSSFCRSVELNRRACRACTLKDATSWGATSRPSLRLGRNDH